MLIARAGVYYLNNKESAKNSQNSSFSSPAAYFWQNLLTTHSLSDKIYEEILREGAMKSRTITNKSASVGLLCALILAYSYICMTKNCFSSSMVFIVEEQLLTKFETGIITASFYLIYAALQIVGGILTDRWNPERFLTVGLVGAALCNLVIYFNQSYMVMLISWTANACLQFAVWPATFKIASTLLHRDMQERSILMATFGNPVGMVLAYIAAAVIGSQWKLNFLVASIGLIVVAAIWEAAVYLTKPYVEIEILPLPKKSDSEAQRNKVFIKIAVKAGLFLVLFLSFTRTMFDIGIKALAPTMINQSYDEVTPVLATVLSIIILISGAVGPVFSHFLYPRFIQNEAVIITLFFLAATPLTAAMLLLGKVSYILIIVLLALVVMLMSAASLFTSSYIAARFNKWCKGATVAGALNCTASFGVVAANTLFTGIADTKGWHGTIVVWIIIMVVSLIIAASHIPVWTKFLRDRD